MTRAAQLLEETLKTHLGSVVFGVESLIHGLCVALIAKGHVLLQGVPGIGKTLSAKTLAVLLGGQFNRIQCTADLMPSDMTGIHIYNSETRKFELVHGPLFADVVLVDEINRAGPKTQSALLQAMEEASITLDRKTYVLSNKFFVIATQNPQDFEGTYPLPESQLDRFLLRLEMSYPEGSGEEQVLRRYDHASSAHQQSLDNLPVLSDAALEQARQAAADVHVSDAIYHYVLALAAASRVHPQLSLGLSTRGALSLMRCARAEAALRAGEFVLPDDVKEVAARVMAHRLVLTPDAILEGVEANEVVGSILGQVTVPRE